MEISTNYSNQYFSTNTNKQQNKNLSYSPVMGTKTSKDVNFTGLGRMLLKPVRWAERSLIEAEKENYNDFLSKVVSNGLAEEKVIPLTKGEPENRLGFLYNMVNKIGLDRDFYLSHPEKKQEHVEMAFELYKRIKKPKPIHTRMILKMGLCFDEIKACFDAVADSPKKLNKLFEINYMGLRNRITGEKINNSSKIFMDIVKSPNIEEYLSNYDRYRKYIIENSSNKNVIKNLDKQIAAGKVDTELADKNYIMRSSFKNYPKTLSFTKEEFEPIYTKEGMKIIRVIGDVYNPTAKSLDASDAKAIKEIYRTTTPENVEFRANYIRKVENSVRFLNRETILEEICQLFNLCDDNPHMQKAALKTFFQPIEILTLCNELGVQRVVNNIRAMEKTWSKVDSSDGSRFSKVIEKYKGEPESIISKIKTKTRSLFSEIPSEEKFQKRFRTTEFRNGVPLYYNADELSRIDREYAVKAAEEYDRVMAQRTLGKSEVKTEPKVRKRSFIFKPHIEEQPSERKKAAMEDVKSIIKQNLGTKTYMEQEKVYTSRATGMRVKMLPEIFASIKDTRAAARANSSLNRQTVKNADAASLYMRINHKNKDLVDYMLKARNADGTRKYDIKQIVDELVNISKDGYNKKQIASKENPFTKADEKNLYVSALQDKVFTLGKLGASRQVC